MPIGQVVINAAIRGGEISMLAIGVTMLFAVLRFANFAHGEFALAGAYLAFFFSVNLGLNLLVAAIFALVLTGLIGICENELIFKRLRGMGGLTLMIAALGLSIAIRNIVRAVWGAQPRSYTQTLPKIYDFLGLRITSIQLLILVTTGVAVFSFHFLLHKTTLGKAMRALSDNLSLAQASGIDVEKVIRLTWFICAFYAGLGGILMGMESLLWPQLGFRLLLSVFCAVILGGIGNPYGAVAGAMVIGFAENLSIYFNWSKLFALIGVDVGSHLFIPTGYKYAITFIILIMVLIIKPTGILRGRTGD